jgi:hypothetical protein
LYRIAEFVRDIAILRGEALPIGAQRQANDAPECGGEMRRIALGEGDFRNRLSTALQLRLRLFHAEACRVAKRPLVMAA